jgi:hypothetical protein
MIHKVYPELRCEVCGNVLATEEPETVHVFVLLVKPCQVCAAQRVEKKSCPIHGLDWHGMCAMCVEAANASR